MMIENREYTFVGLPGSLGLVKGAKYFVGNVHDTKIVRPKFRNNIIVYIYTPFGLPKLCTYETKEAFDENWKMNPKDSKPFGMRK